MREKPIIMDAAHRDCTLIVDRSSYDGLPPVMLSVNIPGASVHCYLTHAEALALRDALDEAATQRLEVAA